MVLTNGHSTHRENTFLECRHKDPRLRRVLLPGDPVLGLVRRYHFRLYQRTVVEKMAVVRTVPGMSCSGVDGERGRFDLRGTVGWTVSIAKDGDVGHLTIFLVYGWWWKRRKRKSSEFLLKLKMVSEKPMVRFI